MKKASRMAEIINGHGKLVILAVAAVVLLSLPWLRPATLADEVYLPIVLAELSHRGYFHPEGARAAFLGDAGSWLPFLEQNGITPIAHVGQLRAVADGSLDFVLSAGGSGIGFDGLVDRVLKVGGVAAILPALEAFRLPGNYKVIYAHHTKATAFAIKKIASSMPHRRLLAVPEAKKKEALDGLEGVLLEPPRKRRSLRRRLRPKYLPELTGDSLEGYRRRVFVDVAPSGSGSAASWFNKYYPRGNREFEIVRLKEAESTKDEVAATEEEKNVQGGMGEWLEGNVREEDYVVVKAGAEAVEEMVRKGGAAARLVDELFLECGEAAGGGGGHGTSETPVGRPYWECLALYGRLRDQGVAVHQWWGSLR